ncbi:hypothetical protein AB6A40_001560 [Gnathostoma spinigerum]|uniref:Maturase K n=1 Tax=Gnathostoma spinigerum TaxID=75299 RepID=A0ABD6E6R4_9BILA
MLLYTLLVAPYRKYLNPFYSGRPLASEVLKAYLRQRSYPSWTSFFVAYRHVQDDSFGEKHFNFAVDGYNYQVLRIGCFPFIKYHCTKRAYSDLSLENSLFKLLTVINLGIPCLLYGIAAVFLIKHTEYVIISPSEKKVPINFLIREEHS